MLKYYVQDGKPVSYQGGRIDLLWKRFFEELDPDYEPANSLFDADLVLWTGGHDVTPALYGELPHTRTHTSKARDLNDLMAWNLSGRAKIRLGICRGAQFLNVINGGSLWQDVRPSPGDAGHSGVHDIIRYTFNDLKDPSKGVEDQSVYSVTSTHHQMMRPGKGAVVMGYAVADEWASMSLCERKSRGGTVDGKSPAYDAIIPESVFEDDDLMDPEVIFYPKTGSLCIQGHPEFFEASDEFILDTQLMILEALECVES